MPPEEQAALRLAVVDADDDRRGDVAALLFEDGYDVIEVADARTALATAATRLDALVLDVGLRGAVGGRELLKRLLVVDADIPVILLAADDSAAAAVEAMREGAYDYLTRPVDEERLLQAVGRACERSALARYVRDHPRDERRIVGRSPAMQEVARTIERVLKSDATVCIHGQSGTGKELVARAIHERGHRQGGPFVAINCAAVPSSLHASELFGHERGAFTGATRTKPGCFEEARGGTLFLDEVAEMSTETQAALLRTLQERTIRRLGGTEDIEVDARIVCATHRDLRALVDEGRFREDLFYRLMVFPVELPALAERREDIPALVARFLQELQPDVSHRVSRIHPEALDALVQHHWPGNVRELRNVVHRAMLSTSTDEVRLEDLPRDVRVAVLPSLPAEASSLEPPPHSSPRDDIVIPLAEVERREIEKAMRVTEGHVGDAAKLLGIGRATLYRRLAKLEEA